MSRASDIAAIVRCLDRAAESDAWHSDTVNVGMVGQVAAVILEHGDNCERFCFEDWTSASIRAATLGYAIAAPDDALRALAWWARHEHKWIEWWDREGWLECEGWIPLPWFDETAVTA